MIPSGLYRLRKPGRPKGSLTRKGECSRYVQLDDGWDNWSRLLGERIRYIREEQDVAASELACATGVATYTVHKWESGRAPPTLRRIKQIADCLGVLPLDLMPISDE